MNLNDLIRIIPKEHWDKIIVIYLPGKENPENVPLIEVTVGNYKNGIQILLEADYEE